MKPLKEIGNGDFYQLRKYWSEQAAKKGLSFTDVGVAVNKKVDQVITSPKADSWIKRLAAVLCLSAVAVILIGVVRALIGG